MSKGKGSKGNKNSSGNISDDERRRFMKDLEDVEKELKRLFDTSIDTKEKSNLAEILRRVISEIIKAPEPTTSTKKFILQLKDDYLGNTDEHKIEMTEVKCIVDRSEDDVNSNKQIVKDSTLDE